MNRKILFIGHLATYSSLTRAMLHIEPMKRALIRFVYSSNITDKSFIHDSVYNDNILKTQHIKLLFIDNSDPVLIQKIRFGEFGNETAMIPIIVFSTVPFSQLASFLILHHIHEQKTFLQIPFTLENLQDILTKVKFLDKSQLERIRSNKSIFASLIDSESHSIINNNYKEKTLRIIKIAEDNFPSKYVDALAQVKEVLKKIKKNEQSISELKNILTCLKKEVLNES